MINKTRKKIINELIGNNDISTLKQLMIGWGEEEKFYKLKKKIDKQKEKEKREIEIRKEEQAMVEKIEENMLSLREKIESCSTDEIAKAIVKSGGWLSEAARELGVSTVSLKERIERTKYLKDVLANTKEAVLDAVEQVLFRRIVEKNDSIAAMFWLKCQGQERGWMEKPVGEKSKSKAIYLKIMPASSSNGEITLKAKETKSLKGVVDDREQDFESTSD